MHSPIKCPWTVPLIVHRQSMVVPLTVNGAVYEQSIDNPSCLHGQSIVVSWTGVVGP